jgi:hypothetical protein
MTLFMTDGSVQGAYNVDILFRFWEYPKPPSQTSS